jgi:hypothetical protein
MPWWVKLAGCLALILFLSSLGVTALAMGPPADEKLQQLAGYLGVGAIVSGYIWLRAVLRWEKWKFRSAAWWAGRVSARDKMRARERHKSWDGNRQPKRNYVDSGKWFESRRGQSIFTRGKHSGRSLREVAREEPSYLRWMLGQEIADDTKRVVGDALETQLPKQPS